MLCVGMMMVCNLLGYKRNSSVSDDDVDDE
jgi:hypothetical protein